MLYSILVHAHSGLRWVVLLLILMTIMKAAGAMSAGRGLNPGEMKLSKMSLMSVHIQMLIGLVLYFMSPKVQFSANTMSNTMLRFFTVEHVIGMLIAIVLITIGNRKAKAGNAKSLFWYFLIGLLLILATIPWPFRNLGGNWF